MPARCRSCKAPVEWSIRDDTGKAMPLDPEPRADGNVMKTGRTDPQRGNAPIVTVYARQLRDTMPPGPRFAPHFATCPHAGAWRRR